jgi:alpha,alpha-trehalase
MLEIARFWASLAQWSSERGRYEIRGVMGPDEFHDAYPGAATPGLDNNAYTNVMAARCLERALRLFAILPGERCRDLCEMLRLDPAELSRWEYFSRKMFVPFHGDGIISQFEGYEALEEFDWESYSRKYGNIMRLDLILEAEGDTPNRYKISKQADVLTLLYRFSTEALADILGRLGLSFHAIDDPEEHRLLSPANLARLDPQRHCPRVGVLALVPAALLAPVQGCAAQRYRRHPGRHHGRGHPFGDRY